MAMPIEVERAREGSANVRVFVRNGIAYLTTAIPVSVGDGPISTKRSNL